MPAKLRQYQPIWNKIKSVTAPTEVPIRIHNSSCATLIQAVKKEKSMENAIRRQCGLLSDGKLQWRIVDDPKNAEFRIVFFSLTWSYRDV